MDKSTSHKIIKDTLEGAFDKNKFLLFAKNLCNQIDESKAFQLSGAYIPDAFRGYIKSYERLGTFTDPEDKKIDVLIVYLQKETSLERARTAQRNFVARYLKDRDQKDAGLVAFVSPNSEDWRFSLIKMEYKFTEGKSGKVKVKEEFTPARRWSFLVGANENSHTAKSRLAPIVQDDEHNPTLKFFEEAFNIEKVTKEFFEKYRELFLRTKETLDEVVKKDSAIRKDFTAKGVDTVDFAKKLLGQIVFLYFLQKKGWFGVERDADWGSGPKNFLRQLFDKKHSDYRNFFNDILEPLFYEALARERDHDFYSRFNCKIPFLNGGLFDPINNYDWVHTDILLPDDLFSNEMRTKEGDIGDGILDIFDRYNFTVKEDEPLEKEVAIDPETLGKVFENLLEVKDRKSKGTYYTPREIVHYMCVQSLIGYLATELNDKVSKGDLEKLIKYGETVGENEARVEEKGEETQTYYYKMSESVRLNAKLIDDKLSNIRVCDPAIGSGAFLVGMMTEIVRARNTLSNYLKDLDRTLYNFKRDCIQNSLYGVDVDPGAVEIAKLRLWLSLVVDEDDIKQIKPLPNLDYKIMQGNSLLEEFEGVKLFDDKLISDVNFDKEKQIENLKEKQNSLSSEYIKLHQANKLTNTRKEEINAELKRINNQIKSLSQSEKMAHDDTGLFDVYSNAKKKADELKRLHKEFFETTQKKKKDDLKKQIEKLEWDLIEVTLKEQDKNSELKKIEDFKKTNTKPFFLWKLHFADVFEEKGGFDVVIANPPYGANIDEKVETYSKLYPNTTKGFKDIYKIFIDKGMSSLTRHKGVMCYIIPNTLLLQPRYKDVRNFLLNYKIIEILNLGEEVFEEVVVPTCIIFIERSNNPDEIRYIDLQDRSKFIGSLLNINHKLVKQDQYIQTPDNIFIQEIRVAADDEVFLDEIFECKDGGIKYQRINVGLSQKGQNDLAERLFYKGEKRNENDCRFFIGKDLNKGGWYIDLSTKRFMKHNYKKILKENEIVYFNNDLFNKDAKIIWRQTSPFFVGAYLGSKMWFSNTIQAGFLKEENKNSFDLKYILGLLNSQYLRYVYSLAVREIGRVFPQVKLSKLNKLPIKKMPLDKQKPFVDLVNKIIAITNHENHPLSSKEQMMVKEIEGQIDRMVYKLYKLTPAEIEIVENLTR